MRLRLLYHGHCFDGVASAAVFTCFYRARLQRDAEVAYTPLLHTARALEEVAAGGEVQRRFRPILASHLETVETIRRKAVYARGVVTFDLVDEELAGFNKFIPYYVCPETTYSVAVTRGPARTKISVGSNPFSPRPRRHNIATICERYGGGGHAVVGAVSFKPEEVERARRAAREIVAELREGFEE